MFLHLMFVTAPVYQFSYSSNSPTMQHVSGFWVEASDKKIIYIQYTLSFFRMDCRCAIKQL